MDFLNANLSKKVRRETLNGRQYLVAPLTMIVSGVLNGSEGAYYYPPKEVSKDPAIWNHVPIVLNHPKVDDRYVSARSPDILQQYQLGYVFKSHAVNGKLRGEGWFDIEHTGRVSPAVLNSLENGRPIELSTGLFTDVEPAPQGSKHGSKSYTHVVSNFRPDHLAILPDQTGACSLRDGCGVLAADDITGNAVRHAPAGSPNGGQFVSGGGSGSIGGGKGKGRAKAGPKTTIQQAAKELSKRGYTITPDKGGLKPGETTYKVSKNGKTKTMTSQQVKDLINKKPPTKPTKAAATPNKPKPSGTPTSPPKPKAAPAKAKAGADVAAKKAGFKDAKDKAAFEKASKRQDRKEARQAKADRAKPKVKDYGTTQLKIKGAIEPSPKKIEAVIGKGKKPPPMTQATAGSKLNKAGIDLGNGVKIRGQMKYPVKIREKPGVAVLAASVVKHLAGSGRSALSKLSKLIANESQDGHPGTSEHTENQRMAKLTEKQRAKVVDELVGNCGCKTGIWNEEDRPTLNEFSDEKLLSLQEKGKELKEQETIANGAKEGLVFNAESGKMEKPAAPVDNKRKSETPLTDPEEMAEGETEGMGKKKKAAPMMTKNQAALLERLETKERNRLIGLLTANSAEGPKKAKAVAAYNAMEIEQLEVLADALPPAPQANTNARDEYETELDYSGATGHAPNANADHDTPQDEMLIPPVMNFASDKDAA